MVTKYYGVTLGNLSRLIGIRKNGTLYWVGTDHLGSTVRVADASFNAVDQMRYLPYGGSRDGGGSLQTDHKFTGQIEDQSIGLYWYNSRAYDTALGRFVCPDSIVPEPGNPQTLSRYSYVNNNPLTYTDPTGHDLVGPDWENAFRQAHNGKDPTDADRIDRLNSVLLSNGRAWTDADWQRYTEAKQSGALDPMAVLNGTSGSLGQRIKLAEALVTLATSGPVGVWIYNEFIGGGGKVQYGGGPFRQGGTAIGWNGVVYLDESWQNWSAEIIASMIAHESYHAQKSIVRHPYSRGEEVQAFTREAAAWNELRVTYNGPKDSIYYRRETILIYSQRPDGLKYFVDTDPYYHEWFYRD